MKYILCTCLHLLLLISNSHALSISEDYVNSFALIQELGPSGQYGDFVPIGGGTIIEIIDCSNEVYLLTVPSYLNGRDSVFIFYYYYSIDDNHGIHSIPLKKDGKLLWSSLRDGSLDIAIVPLYIMWSAGMVSIDTSLVRVIPLAQVSLGDEVIFFEYSKISKISEDWGDIIGPWSYPIARHGIVSFVPKIAYYKPFNDTTFVMPDTVFYIDAQVFSGAIGSPVFSAPKNNTTPPNLIGILQGPFEESEGDHSLGVVAPSDVVFKLLNIYHGCDK